MAQTTRSTSSKRSIAARVLAPLALVACLLAVIAVVSANTSDSSDGKKRADRTETVAPKPPDEKEYVVEPGDTLTAISEQTGVPIETLEQLNPDLDPQTLNSGQVIKLR